MSTMFTLREAAALIPGAEVIGNGNAAFSRVSTDSRTAGAGDLFVAVKGDRFDAHDFLPQVAQRGVTAVLVSRTPDGFDVPALKVKDTRVALGQLAHGWRKRFALPLVAVTGSNGKTTVKEMISSIFAAAVGESARLATAGNFNNDIGLPLTLFRLNETHRLAVIELGMNHPGETEVLGKIAEPSVAVVNNAQREHQEFMATVEAVALEHASVIHSLGANGTAVFPADDAYAAIWRVAATDNAILDFALHTADKQTPAAVTGKLDGTRVLIDTPQGAVQVALRVLGEHNARNALAATAAALGAGVSLDAIQRGLEAFEPVKGRLQVKRAVIEPLQGATVIDDTYNSNPDSMRAAIDVLASQPSPRILVMGDMGEVGDQGPAFHREVGAYAAERGIEALYALGEASIASANSFDTTGQKAHHFSDATQLIAALTHAGFGPGTTFLVKGSRFMKMERVVDAVTSPHQPASGQAPAAH